MLFGKALRTIWACLQGSERILATEKMDINLSNFHARLPLLLRAISNAHFVSIDLELSGIPGHQINRLRVGTRHAGGKATLQERYEDTKKAAEKYQVLQLGITCVEEHKDRGMSYNEAWETLAHC